MKREEEGRRNVKEHTKEEKERDARGRARVKEYEGNAEKRKEEEMMSE